MARHSNQLWDLPQNDIPWTLVPVALLMDIRDELQAIRIELQPLRTLNCPNFLAIPHKLDRVVRNTTKRRRGKM